MREMHGGKGKGGEDRNLVRKSQRNVAYICLARNMHQTVAWKQIAWYVLSTKVGRGIKWVTLSLHLNF